MGKAAMLKNGLSLITHIEPILNEIMEIRGNQKHGNQELVAVKEKNLSVIVYKEYFESEEDAMHFKNFCDRVYSLSKGQLPPINNMAILFKAILPILKPKEMQGTQSHGQPLIKKTDDGNFPFAVVLKEIFTAESDAIDNLNEAKKIQSIQV